MVGVWEKDLELLVNIVMFFGCLLECLIFKGNHCTCRWHFESFH